MSDTKTLRKRVANGIKIVVVSVALALGVSEFAKELNNRVEVRFQNALSSLPRQERIILEEKIRKGDLNEAELKRNMIVLDYIQGYFRHVDPALKQYQEYEINGGNLLETNAYWRRAIGKLILETDDILRNDVESLNPMVVSNKEDLKKEIIAIRANLKEILSKLTR